jgi:hypothetical protein
VFCQVRLAEVTLDHRTGRAPVSAVLRLVDGFVQSIIVVRKYGCTAPVSSTQSWVVS